MAILNFPTNPAVGKEYIENNVIYTWNGEYWEANTTNGFDSRYVEVEGDNMTGALTLGTDQIKLNADDGSAQFGNNNVEITKGGVITGTRFKTTGDARDGAETGWMVHTGRGVEVTRNLLDNDGNIGQALIRGYATGNATPAFELKTDGSAEFAGNIATGTASGPSGNAPLARVNANGSGVFRSTTTALECYRATSTTTDTLAFFKSDVGGSQETRFLLKADGSAEFEGGVTTAGISKTYRKTTSSSAQLAVFKSDVGAVNAQKITLFASGNASFVGIISAPNVTFNLEADDDTKYTATTDAEGNESRVYNGAVLDVKDRLTKLDTALSGLKAALVSTTDHASLKAALITALADI